MSGAYRRTWSLCQNARSRSAGAVIDPVLVGPLAPQVERDHHQAPAAGGGDPGELGHRRRVVVDVLEHVRAHDRVKAGVREGQRPDVEGHVDPWLVQIGCYIPQLFYTFKPTTQRPLGGEVQQRPGLTEQRRAALEQQPLRSVALVRATPPAQGVGAVPVVLEAVKAPLT